MASTLIKTHKELADHIRGHRILHLNSLGKDSIVALEWLANYAKPAKIISVFYKFMAYHTDDDRYLSYLKKRYPAVEFVVVPSPLELTYIAGWEYQTPIFCKTEFNNWEYIKFGFDELSEELRQKYQCSYICSGQSKYESFARASKFYKTGLLFKNYIYPMGLMDKKQVFSIIKQSGMKLHPQYKITNSTFDHPTYYKMKRAFLLDPEYKKRVYKIYPLLVLDEYRMEVLFGNQYKKKQ